MLFLEIQKRKSILRAKQSPEKQKKRMTSYIRIHTHTHTQTKYFTTKSHTHFMGDEGLWGDEVPPI